MKYEAIANPSLYHCGYRWIVVDENWKAVMSEHPDRESAEREAERLNGEIKADGIAPRWFCEGCECLGYTCGGSLPHMSNCIYSKVKSVPFPYARTV